MNVLDFQQGTAEWLQARAGKVTASRLSDVMAKNKTGEAATRRDYKAQIVAEILTGTPQGDTFQNDAMRWGTENEPLARSVYEMKAGVLVHEVGFVIHPTIERAGASPDGLVEDDGLIEIKCPKTATHLATLLDKKVPSQYQDQIQWQLACTGRKWCDFVSFDPRLPAELQALCLTVDRDEARINELETEVIVFLKEVDAILEKLATA